MKKSLFDSVSILFDQNTKPQHIHVLDGWRGLSILFVLAAHLLPLGRQVWQINSTVGILGMSLFFVLSGFLITNFLHNNQDIRVFLIRRFFRILPLAWLYIAIVLTLSEASNLEWVSNLFFYANWPPITLLDSASHFWSLCVEMQFYFLVALLVLCFKKRGLLVLPLICIAVTLYRVENHVYVAINTYYRLDEILAGCVLAIIYNSKVKLLGAKILSCISPYFVMVLLVVACHPESGSINYFRPYLAAILIGVTLFTSKSRLNYFLNINLLSYLALISFALYVIHGGIRYTWLGEGDTLIKYAKRPALFGVTFFFAHFSTLYYEKYFIGLGRRLSARFESERS